MLLIADRFLLQQYPFWLYCEVCFWLLFFSYCTFPVLSLMSDSTHVAIMFFLITLGMRRSSFKGDLEWWGLILALYGTVASVQFYEPSNPIGVVGILQCVSPQIWFHADWPSWPPRPAIDGMIMWWVYFLQTFFLILKIKIIRYWWRTMRAYTNISPETASSQSCAFPYLYTYGLYVLFWGWGDIKYDQTPILCHILSLWQNSFFFFNFYFNIRKCVYLWLFLDLL